MRTFFLFRILIFRRAENAAMNVFRTGWIAHISAIWSIRSWKPFCKSEMAYFILPNYCDYPNANFFMFNERSNCFFQGQAQLLEQYLNVPKRFIVVSNTGKENFRQAFEQHTNQTPEILFLRPKEYGKNSIDGDLLLSDDVERIIRAFL